MYVHIEFVHFPNATKIIKYCSNTLYMYIHVTAKYVYSNCEILNKL